MQALILLACALLYSLIDYLGYNAAQQAPTPHLRHQNTVAYRNTQVVVFLAFLLALFLSGNKGALVGMLIYQLTFVFDALYYVWAWVLNIRFFENRATVRRVLRKPEIPHARWSIVGVFTRRQMAVRLQVLLGFLAGMLVAQLVGAMTPP